MLFVPCGSASPGMQAPWYTNISRLCLVRLAVPTTLSVTLADRAAVRAWSCAGDDGGAGAQERRLLGLGSVRRAAHGRRCVMEAEASRAWLAVCVCLSGAWVWARGWDDDQLHRPVPNTNVWKEHAPLSDHQRGPVCLCAYNVRVRWQPVKKLGSWVAPPLPPA